jgi:hypothetical protein
VFIQLFPEGIEKVEDPADVMTISEEFSHSVEPDLK